MPVVVVGLNHKTAPIALLERTWISEDSLSKALHQLGTYEHVSEGIVLSTCNRTEVYATVSKFHGGAQNLRNFIAEFCHVAPEELADRLYTYHDEGAVRHLFRVAAGIDSLIVGESEILGQVRKAHEVAAEEGLVGRILGMAFRRASRTGKRARTETAIGRNPASVSSAAVDLARRAFDDATLEHKRIAIIGAGKMGRLAARVLRRAGGSNVVIVNRTDTRAHSLAEEFDAVARPWSELVDVIAAADIVISSTTATGIVIERATVASALHKRGSDDLLLIIDIAVPRDVDSSVAQLPGVTLRDIEDLRAVVETTGRARLAEVSAVESIIATEVDSFLHWERAAQAAPTASALIDKAEGIRRAELDRAGSALEGLTPGQREAVEHLTRRMVAKLLHSPLSKTTELAGSARDDLYLAALRELFELDEG
jgi:glutamyl-tRNA reductase